VDEVLENPSEIRDLHDVVTESLDRWRPHFQRINFSGLHALFQAHNLDPSFLSEDAKSLYPGKVDEENRPIPRENVQETMGHPEADLLPLIQEGEIELCPNPWTLMYITESGDVHTCFMARPMGNLFEKPLIEIWNSSEAVSARSHMLSTRYAQAGCSPQWCGWREGRLSPTLPPETHRQMVKRFRRLTEDALGARQIVETARACESETGLGAVRRRLLAHSLRIRELEGNLVHLCEKNKEMLDEAAKRHHELAATDPANRVAQRIAETSRSMPSGRKLIVRLGLSLAFRLQKLRRRTIRWLEKTAERVD
jgi:hypothetical protein